MIPFEIKSVHRPSPPFSWSGEQHFDSMNISITLLGKEAIFSFPPHGHFPQMNYLKPRNQSLDSFEKSKPILCNPPCFYQQFNRHLEQLWSCWELMVLGQPIYVMSDTPNSCSQIVLLLIELIKPIPFGGDYRPYFTIQDSDFSTLVSRKRVISIIQNILFLKNPPQGVILGVTNRVFSKVLEHWPNYISTAKEKFFSKGIDFLNLESVSYFIGKDTKDYTLVDVPSTLSTKNRRNAPLSTKVFSTRTKNC